MRLRFVLRPAHEAARLPVHYNALIQGFIYLHLDEHLATQIHDHGAVDGKRRLRLFTFSRLMGRARVDSGTLRLSGPCALVVASPMVPFLESLALRVVREGRVQLGPELFHLESVEVQQQTPYQPEVTVRALSPITMYSTLLTPTGGKKTYYYAPSEPEFEALVLRNLERKARVWYGEVAPAPEASVRPYRVGAQDQHVLMYRDTVIKGWTGLYRLRLPEPLFRMALDAGLGAKNSQGFGCVEIHRPREAAGRRPVREGD